MLRFQVKMHIEPTVLLVPARIDDDILDYLNSDQGRQDDVIENSGKCIGFLIYRLTLNRT